MKIRNLILMMLTCLSFIFANSALAYEVIGCNVNGADKSADHRSDNTPNLGVTRNGNKGKGNGGESQNVYLDFSVIPIELVLVECIKTESEDATGSLYIDFGNGFIYAGSSEEFDPGKVF